jgi:hypothetical protein
MPHDEAYSQSEKKIEKAMKSGATDFFTNNTTLYPVKKLINNLSVEK